MKPDKKVYPQSRLKTLPEPRQAQIVEYLELASIEELVKTVAGESVVSTTRLRPPTLLEGVQWLAKDGIITNAASLSEFRSWFLLRQSMRANEESAKALLQDCKAQGWVKKAEEERAAAQIFFTRQSVSDQNLKGFAQVERLAVAKDKLALDQQSLAQQKEQFALEREKFQFSAAEAVLKALPTMTEIAGSTASNSEKIDKLGQIMFGEDWKS